MTIVAPPPGLPLLQFHLQYNLLVLICQLIDERHFSHFPTLFSSFLHMRKIDEYISRRGLLGMNHVGVKKEYVSDIN
jgi:hypothetical protein